MKFKTYPFVLSYSVEILMKVMNILIKSLNVQINI